MLGFAWHISLWFFGLCFQGLSKCLECRDGSGKGRAPHTLWWTGTDQEESQLLTWLGNTSWGLQFCRLDSVPGLGASSLGWGAAKLCHSCLVRARHEIDAFCTWEEENTVAVTVGGHTSQSTGRQAVSGVSPLCRDSREGSQGGSDRHSVARSRSSRAKHKENLSPGPQLGLPWHYPTLFEEGKSLVTTSTFCSLNLSCKN